MLKTLKYIVPIVAILATIACDERDDECRQDMRKNLGIEFYAINHDTINERDTMLVVAFLPDSMSVKGIGNDSILFSSPRNALTLPINKADTITGYEIYLSANDTAHHRQLEATDTIYVTYENREKFVTLECGCYVEHLLHSVAHTMHNIDSMQILNAQISNADDTHLSIYIR